MGNLRASNKLRSGGWAVTLKDAACRDIHPHRAMYNSFIHFWRISPYREILEAWLVQREQMPELDGQVTLRDARI
jgi:hypothetical protein